MSSNATRLVTGRDKAAARQFIEAQGLRYESPIDDLVGIYQGDRLIAAAARSGFVFKMVAVDPSHQGGECLAELLNQLIRLGREAGEDVFFVFTKPEHTQSFEYLNFRLLVTHASVSLLEFGGGLDAYYRAHAHLQSPGRNGAVVINGNPFTRGHLHLVETAAARVETLYLFVVREEQSVFPFSVRLRLARESTRHIANLKLLDTSRYAVSAGTFPSYFLKTLDDAAYSQMQIDLRLFAERIAPYFGIKARFAGREPYSATTSAYNRTMAEVLPEYGLEFTEIPRAEWAEGFISATTVRQALTRGDLTRMAELVPEPTLRFLLSPEGRALAQGGDDAHDSRRNGT
jgi:[citrate (pro-3S)-lyase] ligase